MIYLKKGFTLVELLIVITMITFLALIIIGGFRSQIFKGKDARRKSDIKKIQIAVEEYEKDNDCYPDTSIIICTPGDGLRPYLDKIPCDPATQLSYVYEIESKACPSWYRVYSMLENKEDKDIEKVGCEDGCGPNSVFNYYAGSSNAPKP